MLASGAGFGFADLATARRVRPDRGFSGLRWISAILVTPIGAAGLATRLMQAASTRSPPAVSWPR
jgi:hypothetical protein